VMETTFSQVHYFPQMNLQYHEKSTR